MTVRSKWGVIVAAFVIGLVAGVSLDLLRPNTITFIVRANGKVNLVPQVGDVITWVAEASTNNSVKSGWPVAFDTTFEKGYPAKRSSIQTILIQSRAAPLLITRLLTPMTVILTTRRNVLIQAWVHTAARAAMLQDSNSYSRFLSIDF